MPDAPSWDHQLSAYNGDLILENLLDPDDNHSPIS
jgi:hypothetical protein